MAQLAAGVGAAVAPLALVAAGARDTRAAEALPRGLVTPHILRALEVAVTLWGMERWRDIEVKPTKSRGGQINLYTHTYIYICIKSDPVNGMPTQSEVHPHPSAPAASQQEAARAEEREEPPGPVAHPVPNPAGPDQHGQGSRPRLLGGDWCIPGEQQGLTRRCSREEISLAK